MKIAWLFLCGQMPRMKVAWLFLCAALVLGNAMTGEAEEAKRHRALIKDIGVIINEILADPPEGEVGDANRDGVRHTYGDEFVELYNAGSRPANLRGWRIADATDARHLFPDTVDVILLPGQFMTVFGGGEPAGFEGGVWVASSGRLSLNNSEDQIALISAAGDTVDAHSYGSEAGRNESLIRVPDGTGSWTRPSEEGWDWPFSPQEANRGDSGTAEVSWGRLKGQYRLHG